MTKLSTISTLSLVAALAGCAGTPLTPTQNTSVSNRPENSGPRQYGSEACRSASVEVVPAGNFWGNQGRQPQYSVFTRAFRTQPLVAQRYSVTSENGQQYVLASTATESNLFTVAGVGVGVAAANPGRGRSTGSQAGKVLLGAALGGALGSLADSAVNNNARAAFDRCRLDVIEGAYDTNVPQYRNPAGYGGQGVRPMGGAEPRSAAPWMR